ncbi:MAG: PEP-utilizing enzyme [Acidimicrobiia bacterium]|nr:PEP-utilizing enzyme [Acidimicrobiia bacterium]
MTADTRPTRVLDGACGLSSVLGGKGAALDRLVGQGMPIPPTGIVTIEAYRRFVADPRLMAMTDRIRAGEVISVDDVDAAFLTIELSPESVVEILSLARRVGDGRPIAVRSSATIEDMVESSFAGQYRSLLDVDSTDPAAVVDGVRLVFASLWHPAPCAYRRAFGITEDLAAMAVVLMQMVPATRAGVVFTIDPGGEAGAARIEAVDGLGESLVSGQRTPDAWITDRTQPGPDLPPEVVAALRLALEVEEICESAQDIEWAWDGEQLWLLQARPITVVDHDGDGFDSAPSDHDLTTEGIGEMLPGVLPPLLWELNSHLVDEAFRGILDDLGVLPDDLERSQLMHRIRGRAALDFSRLGEMARALPGNAAAQLEEQYFGSRRSGRPAAPAGPRASRVASLRHDLRVLWARRRNALEGETVIEAVNDLTVTPPDIADLSDSRLLVLRRNLVDLGLRTLRAELGVAADAVAAYRRIELLLIPHLGVDEAGHEAELVTAGGVVASAPDAGASAAIFAGPTWRELDRQPPTLAVRERSDREAARRSLELRLAQRPTWGTGTLRAAVRTRALRHTVDEAIVQLQRRERLKASALALGGHVRRVHLELGRRLTASGPLAEPTDIDLLTTSEMDAAFAGRPPAPNVVAGRRRWRTRYENEQPLPGRFRGQPERTVIDLPMLGRLEGWAASAGRFTGRAQVVTDAAGPFDPGGVLVAEATDASWSPLFVDAGAIVLERGGPLSHAAILARELGVPAVLNVPGATRQLDGRDLTVDGDAGIVVVLDPPPAAGP